MQNILIFKMWRYKLSALAALVTMIAIFFWPSLPLRGLGNWIAVYTNTRYLFYFYPIIAAFSGIYIGLYIYSKKVASCCSIKGARTGVVGLVTGILFGACPACIPVVAIFLPLAFNIFLSRIAPIFSLISIGILLWAIYRMNGFRQLS